MLNGYSYNTGRVSTVNWYPLQKSNSSVSHVGTRKMEKKLYFQKVNIVFKKTARRLNSTIRVYFFYTMFYIV